METLTFSKAKAVFAHITSLQSDVWASLLLNALPTYNKPPLKYKKKYRINALCLAEKSCRDDSVPSNETYFIITIYGPLS